MEALLALCSRCIVISNGELAFQGTAEEAVNFYHKSSYAAERTEAHVLYETSSQASETCITKIEVLGADGATYLEAAMRCRVMAKLGDTVEVPDELV